MDWHTEVEDEEKPLVKQDSKKVEAPKEPEVTLDVPEEAKQEEVEGVDKASEIPKGKESKYGL